MPPAFVLSQDQTLQTKYFQHRDQLAAPISFFKIQSCRKSFRFAIFLLRLQSPFRNLKINFRVHRTIQFSKITCFYNHHRLQQAQWECNLACFSILSNRFLNFFQNFFPHRLIQPQGFRGVKMKYSMLFSFVKSKIHFFQDFFLHRHTPELTLSSATGH